MEQVDCDRKQLLSQGFVPQSRQNAAELYFAELLHRENAQCLGDPNGLGHLQWRRLPLGAQEAEQPHQRWG